MKSKKKIKADQNQSLPLLDLHGYRVEDVWDALDRSIRKAQNQGHGSIRVMTGKGTGKVREAVISALKMGGFHYRSEVLSNGSKNEGVLIVSI
jgi:dsDNA-specific endonuclease/ATPase MutS2